MILKTKIKQKFGTVSRFCHIANVPYHRVHRAINGQTSETEKYLRLCENTKVVWRFYDVSPQLIKYIKSELAKIDDQKQWRFINGINKYWLDQLLAGKIKFRNKNVERLMKILEYGTAD